MSSPTVALVYPTPFGEGGTYGGGERYFMELGRALSRLVPTRLVTFGSGTECDGGGALDVRTVEPLTYAHGNRNNPVSLAFLRHLRDVDVIHCLSWNTLATDLAVIFSKVFRKRVFVTDVGGGGALTLLRWLPLGRYVDGFLLIAEAAIPQFAEFAARIEIIYAGVDASRYRPDGTVREGVVFVGRLLPHKGVNYLIEAVDPQTPLTVIGRPYSDEYFDLCRRLAVGKEVTFVTDASDDEVQARLRNAAVAVLPSVCTTVFGDHTSLPELLGFAAMEAMASGTPTICTRVGGLGELVVDGESGFLVPPNDPVALGVRIRQLLDDPDLARAVGSAGRKRIESVFSWESVAERCVGAYERALVGS